MGLLLDGSLTRRRRLYWTNLELPSDMAENVKSGNPDDCMDEGRALYKHGKEAFVRTLCSSWTGDPDKPHANSRIPILVDDDNFDEPQQLRPHEAETLSC